MAIVGALPVTRVRLYRSTNNVTVSPDAVVASPTVPYCTVVGAHGFIDLAPVTSTADPDNPGILYLDLPATDDPDVNEQFAWRVTFANSDRPTRLVSVPQSGGLVTTITVDGVSMPSVWLDDLADFTGYSGPTAPDTLTIADLDAVKTELRGGVPANFDTLAELLARIMAEESTRAALADIVAAKVAKSTFTAKGDLLAASGSATPERLPIASDGRVLTADSTVPLGVSWQTPTSGGGGGGSGTPDLPEASRLAYSAAVSPPSDLLSKTTRFTTASAVNQTLPLAQPNRVLAVGWDSGPAALTLAGASRTDSATVTGSSATVSDTTITAQDQGRLVSGTGIPAGTYVGTVTPNTSFLLSSSPVTQTNVNATASSTAVTISDVIGSGTATARTLETPGELLTLHATSTGQWRVYSAHRPTERLTPVGPKTGAYTAQPGELVKVDATSGAITITAPATGVGRAFAVKKVDASTNAVTVARAGSDTIGSAAATSIPVRFDDQVTYFGYDPTAPAAWLVTHNHLPPTAVQAAETGGSVSFRAINTAAQSLPNSAETVLLFPTVDSSSPLVTTGTQGAGTAFTVSRAGVWTLNVTSRVPTSSSVGGYFVALWQSVSGTTKRLTAVSSAFGGSTATRSLSVTDYFAAGTVLYATALQSSGGTLSTDADSGQFANFRLNWLHG